MLTSRLIRFLMKQTIAGLILVLTSWLPAACQDGYGSSSGIQGVTLTPGVHSIPMTGGYVFTTAPSTGMSLTRHSSDTAVCGFLEYDTWSLPMRFSCQGQPLTIRQVKDLMASNPAARRSFSSGRFLSGLGYVGLAAGAVGLTYLEIRYGDTEDEYDEESPILNAPIEKVLLYGLTPVVIGGAGWIAGSALIKRAALRYNSRMTGSATGGWEIHCRLSPGSIGIQLRF